MADIPEERSAGNASIPPQYIPVSRTKFEVEKFDGKGNFGMWKCEVMDMLVQMNLDFTLEDKPEDLDEKSWERINRLACSSIRLCLVKDQKYIFSEQNSAKELWQALEDKFMKKSIENCLYLKKRIFRFQHKKGTSMNEHLNDFNKMIVDLKNLDVEIDDEDKALLLLNSLPDTYEHLVTTLLYGKEKIKFIDVSNALVNNEYQKKDQIVHKESTSEALTGHWKKDCPIKGNKEKDEPTANIARDEDERDSAFMVSSPEKHCGEWILDSAYSYHMSPNKHLFSRLEEFDGGVVLMGNDDVSKVKGIGTIHLKMHNGVVKTLTKVWYVPDLKKNLFSLGVLESSGYKIIMHGGILRAIRGVLVVLRGTRMGNLYFLDGSIVTGTAAVSKSLEDAEANNSRVWHMRLGHAGEKALQGLVKQDCSCRDLSLYLLRVFASFDTIIEVVLLDNDDHLAEPSCLLFPLYYQYQTRMRPKRPFNDERSPAIKGVII
uniref:Uncharacterized protein n=1 Tax=Populus alba TaxID=43335 RepID=A0A4U5MZD1_POPAL|nr:hypothetical protein D5086_0000291950 [Populus alba]